MRKLFNFYLENPETLGKIAQSKINDNGLIELFVIMYPVALIGLLCLNVKNMD